MAEAKARRCCRTVPRVAAASRFISASGKDLISFDLSFSIILTGVITRRGASSSPDPTSLISPNPVAYVTSATSPNAAICVLCNTRHADILHHLRSPQHKHQKLTPAQAASYGFLLCPQCQTPVKNTAGLTSHSAIHSRPNRLQATLSAPSLSTISTPFLASPIQLQERQPPTTPGIIPITLENNPDASLNDLTAHLTAQEYYAPLPASPPSLDHFKQSFMALADLPTTDKPLPTTLAKAFSDAAGRLASKYLSDPSNKALFDLLSLPKLALLPGLSTSTEDTITRLAAHPADGAPPPGDKGQAGFTVGGGKSKVDLVCRLVAKGKIRQAARMLGGASQVAPRTQETMDKIKEKNPEGQRDPFGGWNGPIPASIPTKEEVKRAIRSFNTDTAAGTSGWTVHLLLSASTSLTFIQFLHQLTIGIIKGDAPGQALLCTSAITPLVKGSSIRPIAVGEMFYRIASKVILSHYAAPTMPLPYQLGVGSRGGVEPIITAVKLASEGSLGMPVNFITSLDFSNAFNSMSRSSIAAGLKDSAPAMYRTAKWAYNEPSDLLFGGMTVKSREGVRQGDTFGPLFFSVGLKPELHSLAEALGRDYIILAYLDDVYVFRPQDRKDFIVGFFANSTSKMTADASKTKTWSIEFINQQGMEVLGSFVGPKQGRERFLMAKVLEQEALLDNLDSLPSQTALILLKKRLQLNLRHLMRSLQSDDLGHLWRRLDTAMYKRLTLLRNSSWTSTEAEAISRTLMHLPTEMGGMGILSYETCASHAYKAATNSAMDVLSAIIPTVAPPLQQLSQSARCKTAHVTIRDDLLPRLTEHQRVMLVENGCSLARQWMDLIPTSNSLIITDADISATLHYRSLMGATQYPTLCQHCTILTTPGHDDACVRRERWSTTRHEIVKGAIIEALSTVTGGSATPEPLIHGSQRRNDFRFIPGPLTTALTEEGDVKITALSGKGAMAITVTVPPGATASLLDLALQKARKHLETTARAKRTNLPSTAQDPERFHPIIISAGGMVESSTAATFKRWKTMMRTEAYDYMMKRISVGLIRCRGKAFQRGEEVEAEGDDRQSDRARMVAGAVQMGDVGMTDGRISRSGNNRSNRMTSDAWCGAETYI